MNAERAFRDAMRDIVSEEGVARLASAHDPRVIWEWDGIRWIRTFVDPPHRPRR